MSDIIKQLKTLLGEQNVLTGEAVRERYFHVWQMNEALIAKAVLFPRNTTEMAAILRLCHAQNQPVVIHGGRTNLVGATEATKKEIVISTDKMNQIEEIDEKSRTITVQAGVILEEIQNAVKEKNMLFPLNFGAKGSAQIGGIISTNAGGLRVFRFGMTRQLVLGLEAVLANGTVISSLKKIIKDNSAYDLKQLFVGSEGTLGIVTRAVLKLVEAPQSRNSAFIGVNNYGQVVDLLKFMDGGLAGTLSGFELMWKVAYQAQTSPPSIVKPPLPYHYNYYVLLETLGSQQEQDHARLQQLLEEALEKGMIEDAVMAHTESDLKWFWHIREEVSPMVTKSAHFQSFDVSIPIGEIGEYVEKVQAQILATEGVEHSFPFGHVADGNIHFLVSKSNNSKELKRKIDAVVYAPLKHLSGSVSAEHGIGLDKKAYLHFSRSEEEMALMQLLKRTLDPKGILNPGRVI